MPFSNLPDKHKSRWGDELTAEKMKECIWLRREAVHSKNSICAAGDRLRHAKFVGLREDSIIVKGMRLAPGDTVKACLSNRIIEGRIAAIYETMSGVQIRVANGDFVWNVEAFQVVRR